MMESKKINSDNIISKLMDIWKNDPINSLSILLRNLDNDLIEFDNDTQKLINKTFLSGHDGKVKLSIELKDDNDELQDMPGGKEKIKIDDMDDDVNNDTDEPEEIKDEKYISFTKDVLPYIIPLSCILTMKDSNKDFVSILSHIKNSPELIEIFNEQTYIWWNKKDIITLVIDIVNKYFDKKSNAYNISINFKIALKSLIDRPKELMELINDCLKPKDVEKKKFGEVFTPMNLVNEMLDKLDGYYIKENNKSIFEEKEFKWFDPANGMGNFPIAIYLRLMKGLKGIIKNRSNRKRHILENMLYMSELNKKNVHVCKQIFDINDEYKLNLYCGDSLELDTNSVWGFDKFDVIIGNPPYNASGTKASGNTIWQNFVLKFTSHIKVNKFLCFIHPCGWRKPNTPKGKFNGLYKLMTGNNKILYLEIHNSADGNKTFKCGTRYDWYILKNSNLKTITDVLDENNKTHKIDLSKWKWLPNSNFAKIYDILAKENEEKCNILQSMSTYDLRKKWMSKIKQGDYIYPVIHSTPKNGARIVYSNDNTKGFYGVKKVIFGESGIYNPIIDMSGKYAMTQCAMAIVIDNKKEAENVRDAITTKEFNKIIKSCSWSSFRIEWNMFSYFKKYFYKEFL